MIVCTTGPTPSPPTAFKLDYWQDKFDRVRNEMRCDKCWLRWPQANQDIAVQTQRSSFILFFFLCQRTLKLPAYGNENAAVWLLCVGPTLAIWRSCYLKLFLHTVNFYLLLREEHLREGLSQQEFVEVWHTEPESIPETTM